MQHMYDKICDTAKLRVLAFDTLYSIQKNKVKFCPCIAQYQSLLPRLKNILGPERPDTYVRMCHLLALQSGFHHTEHIL